MVEIKAADLEVRCFFTWRMKGHICSYGSRGMETGDWGLDGCQLSAYRYPWDGIPERGPRLQTIRLQTLDSIDFTYHSGVPPLVADATTLPGGKHVTGFAGRGAPL